MLENKMQSCKSVFELMKSSNSRFQKVKLVVRKTCERSKYKCNVLESEQNMNGQRDIAENHHSLCDNIILDTRSALQYSTW
jgi:hypothetical protein